MRLNLFLWIVVISLLAIGVWLVILYNTIIKRKNKVENAWSGIEVLLKRRNNLIPNLLEIVKKHAAHEESIMEHIKSINDLLINSDTKSVNQAHLISKTLKALMFQIERFSSIKADDVFSDLQKQLAIIESEIQDARHQYNEAVRQYNTILQSFPALLLVHQFGFREIEYFEFDDNINPIS